MNEAFINLLHQNRAEKEEEERIYHQVWLPAKKYLRRSSSQVHRGNATIWPNHRTMRAAMKKKKMVLPAEFERPPGQKFRDWVQCDMYDEYICPKCYDKFFL